MTRTVWIIAKTKNNRERYAERNVHAVAKKWNIKINTYLPKIELNHKGKEEMLFPGFLFVQTPGQWRFIENTYGCTGVIQFGEEAAHVPHRVIRELRLEEKKHRLPKWRQARKGERVTIVKGPYNGLTATFTNKEKFQRVRILLDFMSKQVPLIVGARDIIPIAA